MTKKHGSMAKGALVLAGVLVLGMSALPSTMQTISEAGVKLVVDHETQDLEHEPLLLDGVTYIPLRECAEKLGYQVEWDQERQQIKIDTSRRNVQDLRTNTEGVAEQGVIPDEETALAVGKIILEKALGQPVEYQIGDRKLWLSADYYPVYNEWRVSQAGTYEGDFFYYTNYFTPMVALNKSTGEVTRIDLEPKAEKYTPLGKQPDGALIWSTKEVEEAYNEGPQRIEEKVEAQDTWTFFPF